MLMSLWVVYTLYNREFNSKALKAITTGQALLNAERSSLSNKKEK